MVLRTTSKYGGNDKIGVSAFYCYRTRFTFIWMKMRGRIITHYTCELRNQELVYSIYSHLLLYGHPAIRTCFPYMETLEQCVNSFYYIIQPCYTDIPLDTDILSPKLGARIIGCIKYGIAHYTRSLLLTLTLDPYGATDRKKAVTLTSA